MKPWKEEEIILSIMCIVALLLVIFLIPHRSAMFALVLSVENSSAMLIGIDETETSSPFTALFGDQPLPRENEVITIDYTIVSREERVVVVNCWDEGKVLWHVVNLRYEVPIFKKRGGD
ncbi:MAG: hypothetical protein DRO01_04750 [Thermoproteota archaeon]|nr:MAG: hypothetical protein DRO01_04750 [Candidatus Korarchaeota archaeon]